MDWSRRKFFAAVASGLALRPGSATAKVEAPSSAARRRLGALARRTLPPDEIRALLASEAGNTARPCGYTAPAALARCIGADFRAGRTIDLGGVRFARSEVASFLRA